MERRVARRAARQQQKEGGTTAARKKGSEQQGAGSATQHSAYCPEGTHTRHSLGRRGLVAGAAALVAGIVAKQTSQPVAASIDVRFEANGSTGAAFFTTGAFEYGVSVKGSVGGV